MEVRRVHSAKETLRRGHEIERSHGRNREYRELADQTKASTQHLAEVNKPLGPLGRGPVLRPREKNDAFIHSWLQETQTRHPHPLAGNHEREAVSRAEQSGFKLRANRHKRRPRPSSDPPHTSPKTNKQPGYRFEKRARHKTRNDKYECKAKIGKKRVLDGEFVGPGTAYAEEKDRQKIKRKYATQQKEPEVIPSQLLRQGSKSVPGASRISQALTRRASEPHASKSKRSKSQKEDKELEELSAFFSRQRPNDKSESREYGYGDHETHSPRGPFDFEPQYGPSGRACSSSHGSQQTYRSDTQELPRYSSSLPTFKDRGSGRATPSRPRIQSKSGSTWSHDNDGHIVRHESASFYSERADPRHSMRTTARDTLGQHENLKPAAVATVKMRSPENGWVAMRSTCKDAAAQTDSFLKTKNPSSDRSQRLDGVHVSRDRHLEIRAHSSLMSPRAATQAGQQLLVDREAEDWSVLRSSRCLTTAESDVKRNALGQTQNHEACCDLLDRGQAHGEGGPVVDPATHLGGTTQIFHHDYTKDGDLGSFSGTQAMPTELMDCIGQQRDTYGSFHRADYQGGIPGDFRLENLEEFIQRIEGEVEIPRERVEDGWTLPYNEWHQEQRQAVLTEAAGFDGAHDTAVIPSRGWLSLETEPFAPFPAAHSTVLPQEVDITCPTSLSMLESYPLENQDENLTAAWLERNMY